MTGMPPLYPSHRLNDALVVLGFILTVALVCAVCYALFVALPMKRDARHRSLQAEDPLMPTKRKKARRRRRH